MRTRSSDGQTAPQKFCSLALRRAGRSGAGNLSRAGTHHQFSKTAGSAADSAACGAGGLRLVSRPARAVLA